VGDSTAPGALSLGGKSFSIPEHAAALLQQAFEALSQPAAGSTHGEVKVGEDKGKAVIGVEPVEKVTKSGLMIEGPESSKQGEIRGSSGKVSYCYRCKTKGHAIEVCHARMYRDICASHDHVRPRCPKFRAVRLAAMLCGFAVEGLGFFHIQHEISQQQRNEARTALISVVDSSLTAPNVISELERLIPGPWRWNVEEIGNNSFKTVFPSKAELLR
jgi:hypothetical protein